MLDKKTFFLLSCEKRPAKICLKFEYCFMVIFNFVP